MVDRLLTVLMPVNCGGYDFANKSGEFLADPFIKDNARVSVYMPYIGDAEYDSNRS